MNTETIVRAVDLRMLYPASGRLFRKPRSFVHAVDGVSLEVGKRERVGLVGESGCGKTTVARILIRLQTPSAGDVLFQMDDDGPASIAQLSGAALKRFRRRAQMVFQDPYESMNPRRTILDTVAEPLAVQRIGGRSERREKVTEMLDMVGLNPASAFLSRYPHELSGGQRQRIAIARALIVEPTFVVADEPTSMLDVSVRAGIMKLMTGLADRLGISYLFITHDLAVARYMCDRIAVMYLGKIVEEGETEALLNQPLHPYSKALLSAVPVLHRTTPLESIDIKSPVVRPIDPPDRCRFYDRCPIATDFCRDNPHPPLEDKGNGRLAACYLA